MPALIRNTPAQQSHAITIAASLLNDELTILVSGLGCKGIAVVELRQSLARCAALAQGLLVTARGMRA